MLSLNQTDLSAKIRTQIKLIIYYTQIKPPLNILNQIFLEFFFSERILDLRFILSLILPSLN